jgi:3-keto-5-aminohexanoate cleavage enzyme
MDKLVITAALVGGEINKEDFPALPVTPEEIAEEAYACRQAGCSMVHLHVRDKEGKPTQSAAVFAEVIDAIRAKCPDLIVQPSTGGSTWMSIDQRIESLNLKPEIATLTTGTVNFGDEVFMNDPKGIETIARRMQLMGVKPEIEVFDAGMVENALRLVKKGLIETPLHFDFVMNVPGGIPGTPKNLMFLTELIPPGSTWTVAGVGRSQLPMSALAIIMGGHVRTGFEDNVFYAYKQPAKSNAELVARVARLARELQREVATPDEAREILHLRPRK